MSFCLDCLLIPRGLAQVLSSQGGSGSFPLGLASWKSLSQTPHLSPCSALHHLRASSDPKLQDLLVFTPFSFPTAHVEHLGLSRMVRRRVPSEGKGCQWLSAHCTGMLAEEGMEGQRRNQVTCPISGVLFLC